MNTNDTYIDQTDKKHQCDKCNKIYSSKSNLNYHRKSKCDVAYSKIELLQNRILELEKIIEDLTNTNIINYKNQESKPDSKQDSKPDTKPESNPLVSFGTEDVNLLTPKERAYICSSAATYLVEGAKYLHFNKRLPEYRNVLITNLRAKTGKIYKNNMWKEEKMDNILNSVVANVNQKCKLMYTLPFPENTKQNRLDFTKDYVTGVELLSDPMARREDVKLMIYNETKLYKQK
jgi:hypothetical protein